MSDLRKKLEALWVRRGMVSTEHGLATEAAALALAEAAKFSCGLCAMDWPVICGEGEPPLWYHASDPVYGGAQNCWAGGIHALAADLRKGE